MWKKNKKGGKKKEHENENYEDEKKDMIDFIQCALF